MTGFFEADELTPGLLTLSCIFDVQLGGVALPEFDFVVSGFDLRLGNAPLGMATVSTDSTFIDVVTCTTVNCTEGFLFLLDDARNASLFDSRLLGNTAFDSPLREGGFSFVSAAEVPLPASGLLIIAALGGLAAARLRGAKA